MKKYLFLIIAFISFKAFAQNNRAPGFIDSSFGINGISWTSIQGGYLLCKAAAQQKDGKMICAGEGAASDSVGGFMATRYTQAGVLDSTFGIKGISFTDDFNNVVIGACQAMAFMPDVKILLSVYVYK